MFGRKSSQPTTIDAETLAKEDGKGRPTPRRRDQEAANKARAKTTLTRQERADALRQQRLAGQGKTRQAMRTGDERYLPARDRGPVKRFVRDWVDSHFMVGEALLPLLVVVLLLSFVSGHRFALIGDVVVVLVVVVVAVNSVAMHFALRRELAKHCPGQSYAGTTYYAILRSTQLRFLRMPKPQVKMGAELPETYK